mmetsp:Transcript_26080/g.66217  ORF Transcript_26080/g.66217 Transcript_26080/m.66217 type:complete len:399 (+) Transcript_26080:149-1345(+)
MHDGGEYDDGEPLLGTERRASSGWSTMTLLVAAALSFAGGTLFHWVGTIAGQHKAGVRLDVDLDRALEMAASIERRALPLPANCYPLVDAKAITQGRSLIMTRTRIRGIRQFSFFFHPLTMDQYASQEMIRSGLNHPSTTEAFLIMFRHCFGTRPIFFDIGANIGYFTLLNARLGARVIAIEPTPYHRRLLRLSLTINQLAHTVTVVPRALSASATEDAFACMDMDPTNAGNTIAQLGTPCRPEMLVKMTTLGRVIEQHGPPEILKVDIEGFEMLALKGGEEQLARSPPSAIIFEYNSFTWPVSPMAQAWIQSHPDAGVVKANGTHASRDKYPGGLAARNRRMAAEFVTFFLRRWGAGSCALCAVRSQCPCHAEGVARSRRMARVPHRRYPGTDQLEY